MYSIQDLTRKLEEMLNAASEEQQDKLIMEISKNVLDPSWTDYIFHSNEFTLSDETVDFCALADKILSYQAIRL